MLIEIFIINLTLKIIIFSFKEGFINKAIEYGYVIIDLEETFKKQFIINKKSLILLMMNAGIIMHIVLFQNK